MIVLGVPSHLYSASLDGTVRYWDYETALLLEVFSLRFIAILIYFLFC